MSARLVGMLLGLVAVLSLGYFVTNHFKEVGYAQCKADHQEARAKVQKELEELRAERAADTERHATELAQLRSRQRAAVVQDPSVVDWWRTPVPRCAAAYAYGRVHEDCPGAVRPGP